jgi:hypothetical protein
MVIRLAIKQIHLTFARTFIDTVDCCRQTVD